MSSQDSAALIAEDHSQAAPSVASIIPATSYDSETKHAEIIKYADDHPGVSHRAIAEALHVSRPLVSKILSRDLKRKAKKRGVLLITKEDIQRGIFNSAPAALDRIKALAASDVKPEVVLKACADLLDRAGFNPVNKNITLNIYEEMPRDVLIQSIRDMISRARALNVTPSVCTQSCAQLNPSLQAQPAQNINA